MKSVDSRSPSPVSAPNRVRPYAFLLGSLVFSVGGLGLLSVANVGCGNPCEKPDADPQLCGVETQGPEPSVGPCADDSFLDSIPTTWVMQRHLDQEVFVYASPTTVEGWYPQYTDSIFLMTMTNNGDGTFTVNEDLCGVAVSNIQIDTPSGGYVTQSTGFPVDPGEWAPSATWSAKFEQSGTSNDACSVSFSLYSELESQETYSIWGANLSSPLNDVCPTSTSDSKWSDTDGDTKKGFTTSTYIDGGSEPFVDTYICQRLILGHNAAAVATDQSGGYEIKGDYFKIENDQSLYGDNNIIFPNSDPEVRFQADQYTNSYYYLKSLSSGATCAEALSAIDL